MCILELHATLPWKEIFINKFSVERFKEQELETEVDIEFLTKQQMAEEQNMSKQIRSSLAQPLSPSLQYPLTVL